MAVAVAVAVAVVVVVADMSAVSAATKDSVQRPGEVDALFTQPIPCFVGTNRPSATAAVEYIAADESRLIGPVGD